MKCSLIEFILQNSRNAGESNPLSVTKDWQKPNLKIYIFLKASTIVAPLRSGIA